jgi:hypothetical protein
MFRVMREAFQEKRKVVLDRRPQKYAFVFLPKNDSYECWKFYISGGVGGTLDVLDDPEAFLLVDPSGKACVGEPPISAAATLIPEPRALSTIR